MIVSPIDRNISNLNQESQHSCQGTDSTDVSLKETGYDLGLYVAGEIINDCIWRQGFSEGSALLDIPREDY